jgi:hypothetical protein
MYDCPLQHHPKLGIPIIAISDILVVFAGGFVAIDLGAVEDVE